jgi:hypothetical protein
MNGTIGEKVCDSLGYGLSGATQFTNPQKIVERSQSGYAVLPGDPNGLFSPATEGTWVMCKIHVVKTRSCLSMLTLVSSF